MFERQRTGGSSDDSRLLPDFSVPIPSGHFDETGIGIHNLKRREEVISPQSSGLTTLRLDANHLRPQVTGEPPEHLVASL